jgi:tRNA (guanine37-N1)-methyltransferase
MSRKTKLFEIVTIFPETVTPYLNASILGRAQNAGLIKIQAHDLRDWSLDRHRKVDDTPYGGGPGMVMGVGAFDRAASELVGNVRNRKKTRVVLTSASGKLFTQKEAKRLAKYDHLIFLCGRYEGVDERVANFVADEELSIGGYVLTGGELPAMVMVDAIARVVPGVIEKESLSRESHCKEGYKEFPQYTRPAVYNPFQTKKRRGRSQSAWKVPLVLLSGDHKKIEDWR